MPPKHMKYSSANKLPFWKQKRNQLKKSGKLPKPRSSGESKTDAFVVNGFGKIADSDVVQQGAEFTPDYNYYDFEYTKLCKAELVCRRILQLRNFDQAAITGIMSLFPHRVIVTDSPIFNFRYRDFESEISGWTEKRLFDYIMEALYDRWMIRPNAEPTPQGGVVSGERLGGIPVDVKVSVDDLSKAVSGGTAHELAASLKGVMDKVADGPIQVNHSVVNPFSKMDVFKFLTDNKVLIAVVILTYVGCCAVYVGGHYETAFNILVSLASVYVFSTPLNSWLNEFKDYVTSYFMSESDVTPQGGVDVTGVIVKMGLAGLLTTMCTSMRSSTASGIVVEFMDKLGGMERISKGCTVTVDLVLSILQQFLDWFCNLTNLSKVSVKSDPFWEVSVYGEKVYHKKMDYIADPIRDSTFAAELMQLRSEGENLRRNLVGMPNNTHPMNILAGHLKELNDLTCQVNSRMITVNGIRQEPFLLLLMGKSDIGKTTLANCLIRELTIQTVDDVKLDHCKQNPGEYLHLYNPSDQYYSQYNGQHNLVVDEFGYLKDVAGGPSIFAELIQWVNVNPMNLNMADLASKGRVYFRSKNIWATTNRRHFRDIESVVDKSAVHRRLRFGWLAAVRAEFSTPATKDCGPWDRQPDWDKINTMGVADDFSYFEFYKVTDLSNGEYSSESISIYELKERCVHEMSRKGQQHEALLTKLELATQRGLQARAGVTKQASELLKCNVCPVCNPSVHSGAMAYETFLRRWWDKWCGSKDTCKIGYDVVSYQFFLDAIYWHRVHRGDSHIDGERTCLRNANTIEDFIDVFLHSTEHNYISANMKTPEETWLGTLLRWARKAAKALLYLAPFVAVYKLFDWLTGKPQPSHQHGEYVLHGKSKGKKPKQNVLRVKQQAGDDPNAYNIITKLVTRNVWRFEIQLDENTMYQGCVLALQNNIVLMPEHYISKWADYVNGDPDEGKEPRPDLKITFTNCTVRSPTGEPKRHSFTRTLADLLTEDDGKGGRTMHIFKCNDNEEDDVGVCCIPGITGRVITKLFRSKDQRLPTQHRGVMGLVNRDYSPVYHSSTYRTVKNISYKDGSWSCEQGLEYEIPTRDGDCGSPFVIFDKSSEAKITSIHVGGIGHTKGIGVVVDRQGIEAAITVCCMYKDILKDIAEDAATVAEKPLIQSGIVVHEHGIVYEAKAKPIPQASKTQIVASPINGLIEDYPPQKKPAMLHKVGNIDPMANAMFGYGLSNCRPRLDLLRCALDDYCYELFNTGYSITKEFRRSLSFEEAVMGIPGEEFLDGINRKSSPGWPMRLLLPANGKKSAFGTEEYTFEGEYYALVRKRCDDMENTIKKGLRPYVLNNHFLKDELRPIVKSETGKTRLISSCDMCFAILVRKYTLMFSAFVMRSRVNNGVACGVNPYSEDWNYIAKRHGNNNDNYRVIAGDFSGYDKSLAPNDIWMMKDVMLYFYQDEGSESHRIRNALIDEIAQSRHIVNGLIYSWMGGNTSGNPLTTILNSVVGCILDRYVILLECPFQIDGYVHGMEVLKEMRPHVKITRYGDDSLISVQTESDFHFIDQSFFTTAYAAIGMVYTDESKTTTTHNRKLCECTFLKRSFVRTHYRDKRKWMAALSLDTILESIQWSKDYDLGWEFWQNNVEHMLMELSAHPKTVFNMWSKRIANACIQSSASHVVILRPYSALQDEFMGKELNY